MSETKPTTPEPAPPSVTPPPVVAVVPDPSIPGIRIFDSAYVDSVVKATLADAQKNGQLDGTERFAAIAYSDLDRLRLAAVVKIGTHWSALGLLEHDWKGEKDTRVGGQIVFKG